MDLDRDLVRWGAPTLAGLKCGSLFNLPYPSRRELGRSLAKENRRLAPKGLSLEALRLRPDRVLLLLYRRRELKDLLQQPAEAALLRRLGYPCPAVAGCIQELRQRLAHGSDFPHEIGLFLGYPLADVEGFLEGRRDCKCAGCWKVYGDESSARTRFAMYQTCTTAYWSLFLSGRGAMELAVETD